MSDLFSAPPESSDPEDPRKSTAIIPSKVSTLIKLLKESRDVRPASKSVVFTIFQKMLVLYLKRH
jgi:SWI/SNF-related matrix-associated actin-dependent regulator of chromatin subfamily A3